MRQTASELTGEHTCVMVRGLNNAADGDMAWMKEFSRGMCEALYFNLPIAEAPM